MANTKSAKKAVRKITRRTEINRSRRSEMRTEVRKVEEAISSGDKSAAAAALKSVEPFLARTAQKGILDKGDLAEALNRGWGKRDAQAALVLKQERAGIPQIRVDKVALKEVMDRT